MRLYTLIGICLALRLAQGATPPSIVVRYCSGCHESSANGGLPYVPRLAGQRRAYLVARLEQFRHTPKPPVDEILHRHRQPETPMAGIAQAVSIEQLAEAAQWYSGQHQTTHAAVGPARGRELYLKGLPSNQIPACATCHVAGGAPVIVGQRASYLVAQLELFQRGLRANTTMCAIARNLTPSDAKAVAAYAEGFARKE